MNSTGKVFTPALNSSAASCNQWSEPKLERRKKGKQISNKM
jgi:lipoprotein